MSSCCYSGDGRKASHRLFPIKDYDISVQEVFNNELEEGGNSGGPFGGAGGGLLRGRIIFYFLDTRSWYSKKYSFAIFSKLYSVKALC